MLIDGFTVFAQLVNFLILMALLKRFLYKPILRALDEREKKIEGRLEKAQKMMDDAERERNEFAYKNELFEHQRNDLLKQAQHEAEHERLKLIEAARTEASELRAGWQLALAIEQSSLHRDIMRRTREEVFAITRKTLADLASEGLEQHICEVFIRRLHTLNVSEKDLFTQAIQASSKPVVVCSAFELAPKQQAALKLAIKDVFGDKATLEFHADTDQISGIELSTNGHKLSWNIDDYLASFEQSINRILEAKIQAAGENDAHASG